MLKLYYQPSGRLPPSIFVWATACSLALVPIAWIYAWLMLFSPVGPLVVLFSIGYGVFCARAATLTAKWGKARNPARMFKIGAAIGFVGWYLQWVAWISLANTQSSVAALIGNAHTIIDFAADPRLTYTLVVQAMELHLLDDRGRALVKSPGFAWILEIVYLTLTSALAAWMQARRPFCEVGDDWGEVTKLPRRYTFITDATDFTQQLEFDPRETLDMLVSAEMSDAGFSSIALTLCRPSGKAFLSVTNVEPLKKERSATNKETTLVTDLVIDLGLADDLMRQCAMGGSLQVPSAADSNPVELEPAIDQLEAGKFDDALKGAAPYLTADDARLCKDAIRLSALASARLERWADALDLWRSLFDREATAHNALQVATASVMAGNVAQGQQWAETATRLNATSHDVPWMLINTNFITALKNSGNAKLALPYLVEVKELYENLHNTDPTFLTLQGMPLLASFLSNSREIVTSALSGKEARCWYESMVPHIDQDGRKELTGWLAAGMPAIPQE